MEGNIDAIDLESEPYVGLKLSSKGSVDYPKEFVESHVSKEMTADVDAIKVYELCVVAVMVVFAFSLVFSLLRH